MCFLVVVLDLLMKNRFDRIGLCTCATPMYIYIYIYINGYICVVSHSTRSFCFVFPVSNCNKSKTYLSLSLVERYWCPTIQRMATLRNSSVRCVLRIKNVSCYHRPCYCRFFYNTYFSTSLLFTFSIDQNHIYYYFVDH
jgi:hypothetical protein